MTTLSTQACLLSTMGEALCLARPDLVMRTGAWEVGMGYLLQRDNAGFRACG